MLSLTKKVDYGLIAMSHLAVEPQRVASATELARRFGLPQFLLANIMKDLTAGGLVESLRGVRGGYRLARPAHDITLGDMIVALEDQDKMALADCVAGDGSPRDDNCRMAAACPIKDPIRRVHNRIRAMLWEVTLADLTPGPAATGSVAVSNDRLDPSSRSEPTGLSSVVQPPVVSPALLPAGPDGRIALESVSPPPLGGCCSGGIGTTGHSARCNTSGVCRSGSHSQDGTTEQTELTNPLETTSVERALGC